MNVHPYDDGFILRLDFVLEDELEHENHNLNVYDWTPQTESWVTATGTNEYRCASALMARQMNNLIS